MTVAELGLKIDSGPAAAASRELDRLRASAKGAETEFARLEKVAAVATSQFRLIESVAKRNHETFSVAATRFAEAGQKYAAGGAGLKVANDNLKQMSAAAAPIQSIVANLAAMAAPANLVGFALSAAGSAAGILIAKLIDSGPTVDTVLEEHGRLVGIVKDAYRDASKEAGEFLKQSKEISLLQSQQNLLAIQGQMRTQARSFAGGLSTPRNNGLSDMGGIPDGTPMAMQGGVDVAARFREFQEPIQQFIASMEAGVPKVEEFRQAVANIGLASPALAANAAELLKNSAGLGDLAFNGKQAEASIRLMTGAATEADRKLLGLRTIKTALTKATNEARDAYDRMVESIQKRNERGEIEIATWNMSARAAAAFRVQQELVNAAVRAGIELSPQQIAQNRQLAEAAGIVAEKLEMVRGPLASYIREGSNLNRAFQDVAVGGLRSFEDALLSIGDRTKSTSEQFRAMTESILRDMARMLIRAGMSNLLSGIFGGGGAIGGGAPAIGMVGAAGGMAVPTFFHRGGLVGRDGEQRGAYPFPNKVPRLHSGADLRSDEVFAVLQKGEQVIPKGGSDGGVNVSYAPVYNVTGSGPEIAQLRADMARDRAEFPARVTAAVRDGRSRRML